VYTAMISSVVNENYLHIASIFTGLTQPVKMITAIQHSSLSLAVSILQHQYEHMQW
jgi:hypothetical protein